MARKPRYRKHSQRDFAFVEFQGQRIRLPGVYRSPESVRAYHLFLEEHFSQIEEYRVRDPNPPKKPLLAHIALRYLRFAEGHYTSDPRGTFLPIRRAVMLVVEGDGGKAYGDMRADDFGPKCLKEFRDWMIKKRYSRKYINDTCNRIRQMFKWAVAEEFVQASTWHALTTVPNVKRGQAGVNEPPRRQPVAWDDVEAIFDFVPHVPKHMVLLQWYSGARSKSICLATASQFRQVDDLLLWSPQHKNEWRGRDLVLPLGPRCQELIRPFLDRDPDAYIFNPKECGRRVNRRYGNHYTTGTYRQCIKRAQTRAISEAIKEEREPPNRWTPYQMRHARGSMVREKWGVEAAQAVLGHDHLNSTEIYSERRLELAKSIARQDG